MFELYVLALNLAYKYKHLSDASLETQKTGRSLAGLDLGFALEFSIAKISTFTKMANRNIIKMYHCARRK